MFDNFFILAENGLGDLLETVFFFVIALITVLGPILNKFLKKSDEDESSGVSVDESIFGEIENETERPALYEAPKRVPAPKRKIVAPQATPVPAFPQKPKTCVPAKAMPQQNALEGLLDDREALRRAVLAQEILSPPLALRDR